MFELWVVWRYLTIKRGQFFNLVTILSIVGMALGVGTLVVVMAVISGFESTLQKSVVDVSGHILILKRGEALDPMDVFEPRLRKLVPNIDTLAPFVHVEGLLANNGKMSGVVVEGFEPDQVDKTLNFKNRIVSGVYDLGTGQEKFPPLIVGRGLADKLGISVGQEVAVVLPKNSPTTKLVGFTTRLKKFRVSGIVDLGMYEYDTRFLITSAKAAQDLSGIGPVFTGLRVKLTNAKLAPEASFKLSMDLGINYFVRDWLESNHNLFEAIKLEKVVIFVVLLFMTVAACFNIASTSFISVLRRYGDISVFKTMGSSYYRLVRFFSLQGMVIGILGSILGLIMGLSLCFLIAKTDFVYVPAEIYHLRSLPVEVRWKDIVVILVASCLLCFLSTLAPARKGARLDVIEGLRR